MRRTPTLILLLAGLACAGPAHAQSPALDALLFDAGDPADLRARLIAHADSFAVVNPGEAAQSLGHVALHFTRAGEPDSAVAYRERAFALDQREAARLELVRALLARLGPHDAARARDLVRWIQSPTLELPDIGHAEAQGLFAWSHFLAGDADSASLLFAPVESWLSEHAEWRYRMAVVAFDRTDWVRVLTLLTPLAVVSRGHDGDVMDMLQRAADQLGALRRLGPMLDREIAARDRIEQRLIDDMGGHRLRFRSADGFPLGGVLLAPPGTTRRRAAIVLMSPRDTLALYDSLAVGLRELGLAVLLLEPRGSGRSVAPGCPLPESWRGREARMEALVAGDVPSALTALAAETPVDTARYLLVGVGRTGPIALRAAARDRRVAVLMLVSPTTAPPDRGPLRAVAATLGRPVYYQTGPEDFTTWPLIDALYGAGDPRASRVADSDLPGTRTTLFRRDPRVLARFRQWLDESWPPAPARRATPPSRPRKG